MRRRLLHNRGFSLIELLIVIVVLGIIAAAVTKSMTGSVEHRRRNETEREMEMLAKAIVGDPGLTQSGRRCEFGYVGDVGAFPPNLQSLIQNPGGYSTWRGPYLPPGFTQDSTGYRLDAWGAAYAYSGGLTIASTGGGSTMTKLIADAANDYLRNRFAGIVQDTTDAHLGPGPGSMPGPEPGPGHGHGHGHRHDHGHGPVRYQDMTVRMYVPNGLGGMATRSTAPDSSGYFLLDSLPAGIHKLEIINQPQADTLVRYITILPRNKTGNPYVCKFF